MGRVAAFGAVLLLLASGCAAPRPLQESAPSFSKDISFSILEDYDKGEDLRQVEADFLLFKELVGVTTWRGSFGWDDYEPSRGVYDFEWLHRFAELAARHGISLRPYLGYTPQWAAQGGTDADVWNDPPARVADWHAFAFNVASAMKRHPNVLSFEIYNEENARMWCGTARRRNTRRSCRPAAPPTLLFRQERKEFFYIDQSCNLTPGARFGGMTDRFDLSGRGAIL